MFLLLWWIFLLSMQNEFSRKREPEMSGDYHQNLTLTNHNLGPNTVDKLCTEAHEVTHTLRYTTMFCLHPNEKYIICCDLPCFLPEYEHIRLSEQARASSSTSSSVAQLAELASCCGDPNTGLLSVCQPLGSDWLWDDMKEEEERMGKPVLQF